MDLKIAKLSPTKNTTILVETPVPRNAQPEIARRVMEADCVCAEQVGFLEPACTPDAILRLQMMGGEFCANASMATAALLAVRAGCTENSPYQCRLEVSGAADLIPCSIRSDGTQWIGTVTLPLPLQITTVRMPCDSGLTPMDLVDMDGIQHLIIPVGSGLSRGEIERRINLWGKRLNVSALGAILFEPLTEHMEPCVWVRDTDTFCWERGCGSGTAAVGCWCAWKRDASYTGQIQQPGGSIGVSAELQHGAITSLSITGSVSLVLEGIVHL